MAIGLFDRFWRMRESHVAVFEHGQWRGESGELTKHAERVLADLREFCYGGTSCVIVAKDGRIDTHATAVAEGRREVLLRIQHHLNLTDEQLLRLRSPDEEAS